MNIINALSAAHTIPAFPRHVPFFGNRPENDFSSQGQPLQTLPSCLWVRRTCVSRAGHCLDDLPDQSVSHLLSASRLDIMPRFFSSPAKSCSSFVSENLPAILTVKLFTILFPSLCPVCARVTVFFEANRKFFRGSSICRVCPVRSEDKPSPPAFLVALPLFLKISPLFRE